MSLVDLAKVHALVTGGAGFIGSNVVDRLMAEGARVTVFDNFSTGLEQTIAHHRGDPRFAVVEADCRDLDAVVSAVAGHDFVFHLQANADVRGGMADTRVDLEQNTLATWNVLEAARIHGVRRFAFASSAVIYGEPTVFPTPESYMPVQTSLYGASKLAGEAMIQAYSEYFGMTSYIFRFVSWIGERYTHGVIFDFMRKLAADPTTLEVLGDGRQRKSYLDVADGVEAIFAVVTKAAEKVNVYNLGHDDYINVLDLANVLTDELGLTDVKLRTAGGERGWVGDSPFVHLDTSRLKALGWSPKIPIPEGVRRTARYLKAHPEAFAKRGAPIGATAT